MDEHVERELTERIQAAAGSRTPLRIRGGGTKDFYGLALEGDILDTRGCRGIVAYEPTELFVTARAGTRLEDIERALAEHGQMLAFEPPHFGAAATVGGCVASGLSGPRRASAGAVRDFVLGVKLVDGHGQILRFGGQVMKNVAGYDVSRLMAGALGTLGLLLEVTLKVLPRPAAERTLRLEMPEDQALAALNRWAGQPLPISGSCVFGQEVMIRLSGAAAAVAKARESLGGELVSDGPAFWEELREQRLGFFGDGVPLWRLSLPSTTPPLGFPGEQLIEWGGALRWLHTWDRADRIRDAAVRAGGHATLFRGGGEEERRVIGVFQPLPTALADLHRRLKQTFDPAGILNRHRMYEAW
ncbi:MAG: glycolate oxidase subunit GlcE [Betaproteobacteria bacterium]|nr:glycolate oxidase subunit GlcE [Betaproteobacteria bacterium]